MRRIQFPQGGGDKPIGSNNVNNQPNDVKKNNDLASALSGKSAPKFADATDAVEQVLANPTDRSLLSEALGFIKSTVPEEIPEEEEIFEEAEEENTPVVSESAIVEGVEVKDPSDAIDKMLKGEISREGAMAYIKSTIPEGDIPEEN